MKATPDDKANNKYFRDVAIEHEVDPKAIQIAKDYGLSEPRFMSGKMCNETL